VHPQLNSAVSLMIYTPLIVATPVAIAQSPRDITVGLDVQGEMCAFADRGAVRIEQQLSGQSLLVPQGGEASLSGGQLNPLTTARTCTCELLVARSVAPMPLELSVPVHPAIASAPPPAEASSAAEEPIYRVDMPPLTFSSSSPTPPPDPDPQTIVLVREPRLQPDAVFQGHVVAAPVTPASAPPKGANPANDETAPKKRGVFTRFFGLFRRQTAAAS
jgi:hypothetical protein